MVKDFARTSKHLFFFALGSLSTSLASFLLIPLYTRALTPHEYGALELVRTSVTIVIRILSLELHAGMLRWYFAREEGVSRDTLVSSGALFLFPLAALVSLLLAAGASPASDWLFGSSHYTQALQIGFGTVFFSVTGTFLLALLRAQERSLEYSLFSIAQMILTVGLILIFVIAAKQGVVGALLGELSGYGLVWIALVIIPVRKLTIRFSFSELSLMLRYSLPLVPANLGLLILHSSDRYFLNYLVSASELGIYVLATKLASLISILLVVPFWLTWPMVLFSMEKEPHAGRFFARMLTYIATIGSFVALLISAVAPYAVRFIATPAYIQAVQVVPLLVLAQIVYLCYPLLSTGVRLRNQTHHIAYSVMVAALVNLFLNYLLIAKWGMIGAAVSAPISYIVMNLWVYFPSQRAYPIGFEWARLAKVMLPGSVLSLAQMFTLQPLELDLVYRIALVFSFPVLLYLLGFLQRDEMERMRKAMAMIVVRLRD